MENTFFLPIGKYVLIECLENYTIEGEFKGVINFGGIPALWITEIIFPDNMPNRDVVCLCQNVVSISITKDKTVQSKTIILQP